MRWSSRTRRGIALLNVLIFAFLMVAAISAGTSYVSNTMRAGRRTAWDQQAYQVALAGITHAIGWLNKQAIQPVTVFDPRSVPLDPDDGADVVAADENLGLSGDFAIDEASGLWGRYEVCRSANAPNRDGLATGAVRPSYAAASLYPATPAGLTWAASDLSAKRGLAEGSTWRLRAKAYIWVKPTPTTAWGSIPPLKQLTLQADVERMSLTPPTASITNFDDVGVILDSPSSPAALEVTPLDGPPATTLLHYGPNTKLTVNGGVAVGPNDKFDETSLGGNAAAQLYQIFGVRSASVLEMSADEVYRPPSKPLPASLTGGKFFYIDGVTRLDSTHVLNASGVLYSDNQILIQSGFHRFRGLIFANRGVVMSDGARLSLRGALVVGNIPTKVHGEIGATSEVRYQESMLQAAKSSFEQYKIRHASLKVVD